MMVSSPRLADDHAEIIWPPLLLSPRNSHKCVVWSCIRLSWITPTTPGSSELNKNQSKTNACGMHDERNAGYHLIIDNPASRRL